VSSSSCTANAFIFALLRFISRPTIRPRTPVGCERCRAINRGGVVEPIFLHGSGARQTRRRLEPKTTRTYRHVRADNRRQQGGRNIETAPLARSTAVRLTRSQIGHAPRGRDFCFLLEATVKTTVAVAAESARGNERRKRLSRAVSRVGLLQEPRFESIEDWTEDRQRRVASWTFGTESLLRVRKQITLHIEGDPGTIGKDPRVRQILDT
jgi:hypothetical protein